MKSPAKQTKLNRIALPGIAVLVVAIVIAVKLFKPSSPETTAGIQESSPAADPVVARSLPDPVQPAPDLPPAVPVQIAPASALPPKPGPAAPAVSPQARDLIGSLSQLPTNGPVAPEIADAWKQRLAQLVGLGAEALPGISEFLDKNVDLDFASEIAKTLGHDSLRLALLSALFAIDSPDAIALAVRTLEHTGDPREIAFLAYGLQQKAPGQYREAAIHSARTALGAAAAGPEGRRDVGPLFDVLKTYGGSEVIPDLQNAASHWKYYSGIALAALPDGAGIPALIEMAQAKDTSPLTSRRGVALQMLAQVAAESPQARDVIIEQARLGGLPHTTWSSIASALAGDVFEIGQAITDGGLPAKGEKGWFIAQGNQSFYSRPKMPANPVPQNPDVPSPSWSPAEVNQRVAIIDQLLVFAPADSTEALQRSRGLLLAQLR